MDKYEFNIKVEQIKKLVGKGDFDTAMKIADTIDWRRVRSGNLLSMVATVYEKNGDYQEAREILLMAFERAPIGKRLLYKLSELALLEGNIEEAEAYYREFGELSGDDPRQLLLRYMILKAKGAPAQQLIHSLESYTSQELDEKWLYELAELYSLAGMADQCVQTCDRIMLMFGLGKYVEKAMELKVQYAPLTTYQRDLVENRDKYEARLRAVEKEYNFGSGRGIQKREAEYYDDEAPDMEMAEDPYDDDYEAGIQEAEIQGDLARELSQISYEDQPYGMPSEEFEGGRGSNDTFEGGNESGDTRPFHRHFRGEADFSARAAVEAAASAGVGLAGGGAAVSGLSGSEDSGSERSGSERSGSVLTEAVTGSEGGQWPEENDEWYGGPVIEEDDAYDKEQEPGYSGFDDNQQDENGDKEYRQPQYGASPTDDEVAGMENEAADTADLISETGCEEEKRYEHRKDRTYGESETGYKGSENDSQERSDGGACDILNDRPAAAFFGADTPEMDELEIENLEDEIRRPVLNHLMIEARTPEKGLQIAIDALKKIHGETGVKKPVAKIAGGKLSKLGMEASAERLVGKDLLIEEAGDLTQETLEELNAFLDRDTGDTNVVLIDNPKQMERLHRNYPELAGKFECIGSDEEDIESGHSKAGSVTGPEAAGQSAVSGNPRYNSYKESSCHSAEYGTESFAGDGYESAPYGAGGHGAVSYHSDGYGSDPESEAGYHAAPPPADAYGAVQDDWSPDDGGKPAQKRGLFGRRKRIYKELPAEEPYEEEDYYIENEEDPVSAYDGTAPGGYEEELGIDEFAQYACRYANDIDCSITGKSMLALYERIEIMEEDGVPLTVKNAENIIEEAADRAERPSIGKRVKGIFSTKYDKDGFLILKEEHFIY